jgi:hypothetical protein
MRETHFASVVVASSGYVIRRVDKRDFWRPCDVTVAEGGCHANSLRTGTRRRMQHARPQA